MNMRIYYDPYNCHWVQNETKDEIHWGHNYSQIMYSGSISKQLLPFTIDVNQKFAGPIIGILAGEGENQELIGNNSTFLKLHRSLASSGALCVVFTPSGVGENELDGYLYFEPIHKWIKVRAPLPNIIYNRVPFRKMEKSQSYRNLFTFLHNQSIPYFNPYYFSKWDTFCWLWNNLKLQKHLPKTKLIKSIQEVADMLKLYKEIYIKPAEGSKGKGIVKVTSSPSGEFVLSTMDTQHSFTNQMDLWEHLSSYIASKPYIVQQAIHSDRINGKRYDLRLLVHYVDNHYEVSGIGVRMAGDQELTTHIPNGGRIYPYDHIRDRINEETIRSIVNEIGKQLVKETNSFIGEFSIDLGKAEDNQYYIYEVNSKPMVFDETTIKNKGLENLTKLLIMRASTP
jgi:hypothetical protein